MGREGLYESRRLALFFLKEKEINRNNNIFLTKINYETIG